ncbi:hypothetical protein BDK51DRAFT_48981 [Blyttiomyces helicus]|uniref:TRP C-terminal domain-containing protein n=1 Tax=Blyttiomyces helicus TaxID=388810 RepID=A0A4V1IPN5_9FUNG|nr:hypothetical protein BDK51DRAFT_48981 [Blyttiomyces helicus]|eukprot:RKO83677.1 hypothetical protein BDK51DRAFT_48981 [Blyttiomyces helicus]
MTGQLQVDYPNVFATWTRYYKFSSLSFAWGFVRNGAATWTGIPTTAYQSPAAKNTTDDPTIALTPDKDATNVNDVGMVDWLVQQKIPPQNYFPAVVISVAVLLAGFTGLFGLFVIVAEVWGALAFAKARRLDLEGFEDAADKESRELLDSRTEERKALGLLQGADAQSRVTTSRAKRARKFIVYFYLGNLLRIWQISQYPLVVAAAFHLGHYASIATSATITAVAVLAIFYTALPIYLVYKVHMMHPRKKLYSDPQTYLILGPIYSGLHPKRVVWGTGFRMLYFILQGLIVGAFPRNYPRSLDDAFGTGNWWQSFTQVVLLVGLEVPMLLVLALRKPYLDRPSNTLHVVLSALRLFVFALIGGMLLPIYNSSTVPVNLTNPSTPNATATPTIYADDVRAMFAGANVTVIRNILGYVAIAAEALAVLIVGVLLLRNFVMWAVRFARGRRARRDDRKRTSTAATHPDSSTTSPSDSESFRSSTLLSLLSDAFPPSVVDVRTVGRNDTLSTLSSVDGSLVSVAPRQWADDVHGWDTLEDDEEEGRVQRPRQRKRKLFKRRPGAEYGPPSTMGGSSAPSYDHCWGSEGLSSIAWPRRIVTALLRRTVDL